jgi:DNA-binding NarL/FixJ family response regulator
MTRREAEVLTLACEGCSGVEIAERLSTGKGSGLVRVAGLKDELATENRVETLPAAARMRLVPPTG